MKRALFRLLAVFCSTLALARAASLDGTWTTEFDSPIGVQKYAFTFTTADGQLTGTATWQTPRGQGTSPLTEARLEGAAVSFHESFAFEGRTFPIAYHGTLRGDDLQLTRQVGNYGADLIVAHRFVPPPPPNPADAIVKPIDAPIAAGPFAASWASLAQHNHTPDWFRDAKFGIWAHWSAQCVPEQGDWYARNMYIQGTPQYDYHVAHYGHPSKFGFMEFDHLWTAEKWEPEKLMALYKRAGAKYFFALANHHDNFDNYNSKYHAWNSVNVGPKQDIIGRWAQVARAAGLRFGVSNHASHTWHWFQPAYHHDVEGPLAGVPYDAATLTKADGKGKWWDGLDPQDLYGGLRIPMSPDLKTAKEAQDWHWQNDGHWYETIPPQDHGYARNWFLRAQDLVDQYHPDLVYLDDEEIPLEQWGLAFAAHYYNASVAAHGGQLDAVLFAKKMTPAHAAAVTPDIERGVAEGIRPMPWQTDTCIGDWHYNRARFTGHSYKSVDWVVHALCDIVSKNGNLLLSIPQRGDGTIDADEEKFLDGMAAWMADNGEGIFATRPWRIYGESSRKTDPGRKGGMFQEKSQAFDGQDIRFTRKGGVIYAFILGWPQDGGVDIRALGHGANTGRGEIERVELLGAGPLLYTRDKAGLHCRLPERLRGRPAFGLKITGRGLTTPL